MDRLDIIGHYVRVYPIGTGKWEHTFHFDRWTYKELTGNSQVDIDQKRRILRAFVYAMDKVETIEVA